MALDDLDQSYKFSWSDTARAAFSSCLPCLACRPPSPPTTRVQQQPPNFDPTQPRITRARPDELQGLLSESGDYPSDPEAETLSLHSNPGRSKRKRRRARPSKSTTTTTNNPRNIRVFGFDLFGKRPPPIHLPDDEDEDPIHRPHRAAAAATAAHKPTQATETATEHTNSSTGTLLTRTTSSNFDSDAAPLDSAAIDNMTPAQLEQLAQDVQAQEDEERRAKEERRRARQQKKELKRLALALAEQERHANLVGGEFEGFQGSGAAGVGGAGYYPAIRPGMYSPSEIDSATSQSQDGFGPFVASNSTRLTVGDEVDVDDSHPDLDGVLYTRPQPRSGHSSGSGGHSRSDSRSRTSASASQSGYTPLFHPTANHARSPLASPLPPLEHNEPLQNPPKPTKKAAHKPKSTSKSKSSRSSTSQTVASSSSTSPSYATFESATANKAQDDAEAAAEAAAGFNLGLTSSVPDVEDKTKSARTRDFPSAGIGRRPGAGTAAGGKNWAGNGAFLATRGE